MTKPWRIHMVLGVTLLTTAIILTTAGCSGDVKPTAPPAGPQPAADKVAVERSFSEFLAAQGTYCWPDGEGGCYLFSPPLPNYVSWYDPETWVTLWPDYAGLAAAWIEQETAGAIDLGTTVTGKVMERPLADGRALVEIELRARNTLIWGFDWSTGNISPEVAMFGYMPQEVASLGAPPALGDVNLNVRFISTAPGAPLPDLVEIMFFPRPDQEYLFCKASGRAEGALRAASGYPEGTPGVAFFNQVFVGTANSQSPTWDAWPAEIVSIRPLHPGQTRDRQQD